MTIVGTMSMVPRNLQMQSPVCTYHPPLMRLHWLKVCRGESGRWVQLSESAGPATQLKTCSGKLFCALCDLRSLAPFVEVAFLASSLAAVFPELAAI